MIKDKKYFDEKFKRLFKEFDKIWILGIHKDYLKKLINKKESIKELSNTLVMLKYGIITESTDNLKILKPITLGTLLKDGYFEIFCCFKNNTMVIADSFSPHNWDFSVSDNKIIEWARKLMDITNNKLRKTWMDGNFDFEDYIPDEDFDIFNTDIESLAKEFYNFLKNKKN